jgi:hypothetical protein
VNLATLAAALNAAGTTLSEAGALPAARHIRERIRGALYQPHADRLGDAVHPAEGAAYGGAGAGRAATGEAETRGVRRFE